MSERTLDRLLAFLVFLVPLVVYTLTMPPTTPFWDSGEFISACYVLGIPHSPGNPIYVLVGRVFCLLPLPLSIAARVNFLSVVFASLSVGALFLVALSTVRLMYGSPSGALQRFIQYAGPLAGSLFLAGSDTFWRDSTEAEVYALSAFIMGCCTWLALLWYRGSRGGGGAGAASREALETRRGAGGEERRRSDPPMNDPRRSRSLVYVIVYLIALGAGCFLGTILVYPGVLLLLLLAREKPFRASELVVFTIGLGVLAGDMTIHMPAAVVVGGLVVFALLLAWATARRGRFALAATALLCLGLSVHLYLYIRSHLDPPIDMVDPETWRALYAHIRREQYPSVSLYHRKAPLLWQLGHFWGYFREQFRMLGEVKLGALDVGRAATIVPLGLGLLGIVANGVRERRSWALNAANLLANTIGLVLYLNFSASEVRERDYFYAPGFYFFAVFIGIGASALLAMLAGRAGDERRRAAAVVPIGALCIALSLLPIRHNWHSHDRHRNYIARDYGYNMLVGLERDAVLFTNGDNDTFPLWYIQLTERYRTDVRVVNLSLLKTPWYIRQLRDAEPRLPISWSDEEIYGLRPVGLPGGRVAWPDDIAVQHIIEGIAWRRPIYFALSVPLDKWKPYGRYLEVQGMARRLVARTGDDMMNRFLVERSFDELFSYRGILDERRERDTTLYRDGAARAAYVNFAVAAAELGQAAAGERDYAEAIRRMRMSLAFDPSLKPARVLLGTYYLMDDDPEAAIAHFRAAIRDDPREGEYWARLASVYEYRGENAEALRLIDEGIGMASGLRRLYIDGFRVAAQLGDAERAKSYIRRWVERHPDDEELRDVYEGIDRILENEFGISTAGATPGKKGSE